jgi:hypothetical protein
MVITVWTIVCLAGLLLVASAAIGGGVVVWQINIPQLKTSSRISSALMGSALVAVGLWGSGGSPRSPPPNKPRVENQPVADKPSMQTLSTGLAQQTKKELPTAGSQKEMEVINNTKSIEAKSYIVQAGSFDMALTPRKKVFTTSNKLSTCSGVNLRVVSSADYQFLTPQKWVIVAGPYGEGGVLDVQERLEQCGVKDALSREIR